MNKTISYFIGLAVIVGVLLFVLIRPPEILFYPYLEHIGFLKRAMSVLILSSILCLYRIIKGPTAPDRIVAIDMFGIMVVGFCAVLSISTKRSWYIDIGIAWALQSFISTLALAKFLEGKDFDE